MASAEVQIASSGTSSPLRAQPGGEVAARVDRVVGEHAGTACRARAAGRGTGPRRGSRCSSWTSTPSMSMSHERISRPVTGAMLRRQRARRPAQAGPGIAALGQTCGECPQRPAVGAQLRVLELLPSQRRGHRGAGHAPAPRTGRRSSARTCCGRRRRGCGPRDAPCASAVVSASGARCAISSAMAPAAARTRSWSAVRRSGATTCTPLEPVTIANGSSPSSRSVSPTSSAARRTPAKSIAFGRVEIEDHPVGPVEPVGAARPDVRRDRVLVGEPHERRRVVGHRVARRFRPPAASR